MDLNEIKEQYARTYGTVPCSYELIRGYACPEKFLGVKIEGKGYRFLFAGDVMSEMHTIEMHFRNRLSRKISFNVGHTDVFVPYSLYLEEKEEWHRAARDLIRYFKGKEASLKLAEEYDLYRSGLPWRE